MSEPRPRSYAFSTRDPDPVLRGLTLPRPAADGRYTVTPPPVDPRALFVPPSQAAELAGWHPRETP